MKEENIMDRMKWDGGVGESTRNTYFILQSLFFVR